MYTPPPRDPKAPPVRINLLSDTQTRPTPAMREAMARAEVGDEQIGDDPTVNLLCERVADLLGKEAAVFMPSGTMCNVAATLVHCRPGDEILAHETAHIVRRDVVVQTATVLLASTLVELAGLGGYLQRALLFVLGPVAAAFVHLLLSPKRELHADRFAAQLCESPHGFADVLLRLELAGELVGLDANPVTEPLHTVNPFPREGPGVLFDTHPPVGARVKRLRDLDPKWPEKLRAA